MSAVLAGAAVPAFVPTIVQAAAGDPVAYSPATLLADLTAGVATVLPWVGAGVGAAIALMFAFMGIRKGLAFFKGIAK